MRSVLKEFAHEGKNKDGSPNGKFVLDRAGASQLGLRVLQNDFGMAPDAASAHMNEYFDRAWDHYDVNRTGYIDAGMAPTFVRFLGGNHSGANVSSLQNAQKN